MATSITTENVRVESGYTTDLISDADVQKIIDIAETRPEGIFQVKITPTKNIDMVNVVDCNYIKVNKNPLLSVLKMKHNSYELDVSNIKFNSLGTIRQDYRRFNNRNNIFKVNNMVYIEYYYGWMEEKDHKEMTTVILTSGDDKIIAVSDESNYAIGDYIRIKGFDGVVDVAKITDTDTGTITVNKLYNNHEIDSLIEILKTPQLIEDWILYESAYQVASYITGNTSNLPTSWSQEGESATIGVAYTHWREVAINMKTQRDRVERLINGKLAI